MLLANITFLPKFPEIKLNNLCLTILITEIVYVYLMLPFSEIEKLPNVMGGAYLKYTLRGNGNETKKEAA